MSTTIESGAAEGLEGVIAFATEIAEPDRAGGALRYRGIDIEELAGRIPFEQVWGLLVDGTLLPGLAPEACETPARRHAAPRAARETTPVRNGEGGDAMPGSGAAGLRTDPRPAGKTSPVRNRVDGHLVPGFTGRGIDVRADLQAALAQMAPALGLRQLIDIDAEQARDDLARVSAAALSLVARLARGGDPPPVPAREIEVAGTIAARFVTTWRGDADPAHVKAIDAYWSTVAEHGMNASTFTARVVASTGADVAAALSAAVGALSGPLHGGAPARVLTMLDDVEAEGDASRYVKRVLDRGERLMGFGHRVYRAEDPRARVLRRIAQELGSRRASVAEALERAALEELAARRPDRVLATNVEFWSAVVLDHAHVPPHLFTPLFACARMAGWSAHILEQKRSGRLIRPSAAYVGEGPRALPETRLA